MHDAHTPGRTHGYAIVCMFMQWSAWSAASGGGDVVGRP